MLEHWQEPVWFLLWCWLGSRTCFWIICTVLCLVRIYGFFFSTPCHWKLILQIVYLFSIVLLVVSTFLCFTKQTSLHPVVALWWFAFHRNLCSSSEGWVALFFIACAVLRHGLISLWSIVYSIISRAKNMLCQHKSSWLNLLLFFSSSFHSQRIALQNPRLKVHLFSFPFPLFVF